MLFDFSSLGCVLSVVKETFWDTLWSSYQALNGLLLTVLVPLIVGALLFIFSEMVFWSKVALSLGALLCVVLLVLLLTFFDAARKNYKGYAEAQRKYEDVKERVTNPLPRIIHSRASAPHEASELVCLLEPSELFSQDNLVSFYDVGDEGLEVLIGVGVVEIVQAADRKIGVSLTFAIEAYRDKVDKLKANDAAALTRTRVKPTVPRQYLLRAIFNSGGR